MRKKYLRSMTAPSRCNNQQVWRQTRTIAVTVLSVIIHLQLDSALGAGQGVHHGPDGSSRRLQQAQRCTANDLNFSDVSGCVDEFDAATLARSPGAIGRKLCMGLSSYRGFNFAPTGTAPSDWVARRVPVDDGPRAYTSCTGAVIVGNSCTALSASYEGPARNATATNIQTVTATTGGTFSLTGISAIVYSLQGVRLTGKKGDGGSVSTVLPPNAFLDQTFPQRQWSGLVSLDFRPDITSNNWEQADEIATIKIFWLNTTMC